MRSSGSTLARVLACTLLMAGAVTVLLRAQATVPLSIIRDVRRDVLPEAVRITVELDREVPFYQEGLENPSRVFFDLKGTRTVPKLVDAVLKYDTDVARDIRLGRHPNNITRIVIDLQGVSRYS